MNSRPVKPVPSLEKRLGAYALTAAAASAGIGLAAPSADKVLTSGTLNIALNHIPMWTVTDGFRSSIGYDILSVKPLHGGGVMFAKGYAQALGSGASIGASGAFQTEPARMERAVFLSDSSFARGYDPWTNAHQPLFGLALRCEWPDALRLGAVHRENVGKSEYGCEDHGHAHRICH